MSASKCVVLVPVNGSPVPECDDRLRALEKRGYEVWRVRGYSAIDAARNQIAADALARGFDDLMWIDSDVVFDPDDVERLRSHGLPLVCGIYPKKGIRQMAAAFLPDTAAVRFGTGGGLTEVLYCGFGFTLTRRAVFDAIREKLALPLCNTRFGAGVIPYFQPVVTPHGPDATWYLAEDMAFCQRAREAGFTVMADTTIRLWHVGTYKYGWEDAGSEVPRFTDYTFHIGSMPATASNPVPNTPAFREPATPLPPGFPRLGAYLLTYPANLESAKMTLDDFRRSDWGAEPGVLVQPAEWPAGKESAARNYKRALERASADGVDFALILEDDVRLGQHLRHNLSTLPLVRRDQCDYLSLFMPDLVSAPWERSEPHLGYRLARPAYTGPNRGWEKFRLWGSQAYLLSRRFVRAALAKWDALREAQDARVIALCAEYRLPMWYTAPCLIEHAPRRSAFGTPTAYAPDFDPAFRLVVEPGFQPPEAVPGWLTEAEGQLLWEVAAGRSVLELGTAHGRSTVCLGQSAKSVVSVDKADQFEAAEWTRRFGLTDRVRFDRGEVAEVCGAMGWEFDLAFIDTEHDAAGVARDIAAALGVLRPGGVLAFHDYPDPGWPDVRRVVDDHARRLGWKRTAQADYLGVFRT